jgi:hypothetical protein
VISEDLPRPTSSLGSVLGRYLPDRHLGLTINPCGPARAHASRSRLRAKDVVPMTQGTYGRTYFDWPANAGPLSSWENRLRGRLGTVGSTESALIWKTKITPAGRSISRLAVSTRLTNGTGCTGSHWPTPTVADVQGGRKTRSGSRSGEMLLNGLMVGATWPTPTQRDWRSGEASEATHARNSRPLNEVMVAAAWPTPEAGAFGAADPQAILDRRERCAAKHGNNGFGLTLGQAIAIWSTPRASDGEKGGPNVSFGAGGQPLPAQMAQATWATPRVEAARALGNQKHICGKRGAGNIEDQMAATGTTQNGSPATTEKRGGSPNPLFACWLMGWPDELTFGALRGSQSLSRSRRKSSARLGNPSKGAPHDPPR